MRSFSRRIAAFTLVRYVYTWARAVETAAALVKAGTSSASRGASANGGAGAGRGASVSKSSRTFSGAIHALA